MSRLLHPRDWPVPLGVGVLLVTALMTGWTALARDHEDRADLRVWTFSPERAEALRRAVEGRSRLPARGLGSRLSVEAMPARALDLRLMTLLRSWSHADQLPDVVELEVLSAAKFLDDPPQVLGLLPLEGYLARSHALAQALPAARLDAWRRHGHLYGLPAEVHPTTLTYRRDLFAQADVDPAACATWPELADALRRYVAYWQAHGRPGARAIELARSRSDHLTLMLQQRGMALIDNQDRPRMQDPALLDVLVFYVGLVAGAEPVGLPTSEGHARWARDLALGDVAMIWTPDWRLQPLAEAAPELAGNLAMIPLPRFAAGDAPTAQWGGAILAIPVGAEDPDRSWRLLEQLALARLNQTSVSPATIAGVSPEQLYAGQDPLPLYQQLAGEAPPRRISTLSLAAAGHLSVIVARAANLADSGASEAELRAALAGWLSAAQGDLERRAEFARAGVRE